MGNMICGGESAETQVQCFVKQLDTEGKKLPADARDLDGWARLGLGEPADIVADEKIAEFVLKVLKNPSECSVGVTTLEAAEQNKVVECLKGMAVVEDVEGTKLLRLYTRKEFENMHKDEKDVPVEADEKPMEEKKEEEEKEEEEKKEAPAPAPEQPPKEEEAQKEVAKPDEGEDTTAKRDDEKKPEEA